MTLHLICPACGNNHPPLECLGKALADVAKGGLKPVHFDVAWKAISKGNKQKVAKRGANSFMIKRDFDGSLKKSEEEFAERALNRIGEAAQELLPWKCPIKAVVTFCYEVPAGWDDWKKEAALLEGDEGRWFYDQNPDLDNIEKYLFDALEKAFYTNDRLVFRKVSEKRYWTEDRIRVSLYPFTQPTKPKKKS